MFRTKEQDLSSVTKLWNVSSLVNQSQEPGTLDSHRASRILSGRGAIPKRVIISSMLDEFLELS